MRVEFLNWLVWIRSEYFTHGGEVTNQRRDDSALAILYEVFGDGTDYDWALGDDADDADDLRRDTKYKDVGPSPQNP
jgi:hypothetical protein